MCVCSACECAVCVLTHVWICVWACICVLMCMALQVYMCIDEKICDYSLAQRCSHIVEVNVESDKAIQISVQE